MKWLLAIMISIAFTLSGTTQPANALPLAQTSGVKSVETQKLTSQKRINELLFDSNKPLTMLVKQQLAQQKLVANTNKMTKVISYLHTRVGKTWYVFSGISPTYGWDCSGLVYWTYSQLGVKMTHSASVEIHQGTKVRTPKVGDIVGFGWKGWSGAQHVGIYLGNGLMLHAGGARGDKTAIISVAKWAKANGNTKVTYTRVISTI